MTRHVFLFLGTFVAGALVALVVRAARHDPHADHTPTAHTSGEYAPMVSNPLAPPAAKAAAAPEDHSAHDAGTKPADAAPPPATAAAPGEADRPVNTVCAICGMEVDPRLPTEKYQGQTIGFGCRMCPPKFRADPDKYGPYYLRNEVIQR